MSRSSHARSNNQLRIVLTGGPGGGKTTAGDLFQREMSDQVVLVPEAATMVFSGGFPRISKPGATYAAQRAIYHVQIHLEEAVMAQHPDRILLCDRGTVDGAAYWPGEPHDFFHDIESTMERELGRYDAVIFFESAAVGGMGIDGGNPIRNESMEQAIKLDHKLRSLWSKHPKFVLVPHNPSFFKKISYGLAVLDGIVSDLKARKKPARKGSRGGKRKSAKA